MNRATAVSIVAVLAAPLACVSHPAPTVAIRRAAAPLAASFDSLARAVLISDSIPGAVIAIVNGDRTTLGAYGSSDIARGVRMTDSTLLNIASVSKPITALLVMRLVADGKVALDEPIIRITRGWTPPPGFDSSGITVRRVLSHTAGLGMPSVPCPSLDSARPPTSDALRGAFGDRGPLTVIGPPGAHFSYSGGGYTLLQLALESRLGLPFDSLLARTIFAPLGMRNATLSPRPAVRTVNYGEDGKPLPAFRCVGESAGGVYLSARDAAMLLRAYFTGPGAPFTAAVDSVSVVRAVVEVPGVDVGGASYGFGHFIVRNAEGDTIIFHSGGNPGAVAFLAVNRRRNTGIFVAANSERGIALVRRVVAEWARAGGFSPPPVF